MPGRLVTELGNGAPSEFFALRLAVRALEAWLMADSEGVAQHFGVPVSKVPRKPDSIEHPKDDFIKLLRLSKRRNVQQGMLPRAGSGRSAGPEYTAFVNQFVRTTWSIDRAAANSDSLNRALADVGRLVQRVGG